MRLRSRCMALLVLLTVAPLAGCGDDSTGGGQDPGDAAGGDTGGADGGNLDDVFEGVAGCERIFNSLDLGSIELNSSGLSQPFEFDVPGCAHAFMLVLQGPDNVAFILDRLTSPSGSDWIQGPFPNGQLSSAVRMTHGEGVGTALVSNSTQAFEAGTYEAVVFGATLGGGIFGGQPDPYDGAVSVELLWKGVDTAIEGGVLDINLYFTGAGNLTAESAQTMEVMQNSIDRLAEIYSDADVQLGEISYFDIPARFQTITSIDGPDNMLSEMFAESANSPGGLNFFFVDRFDVFGGLGAGIGGISGGLPGPAFRPGSPRSGVAVSLAAGRNQVGNLDSALIGHVMGHEGGHYLGLFHTSEFFGGGEDPLSDTASGQGGDTNLMFPSVGGGSELTSQQSRVIHNHLEVSP